MYCPKFIDFKRECQFEIGILPLETVYFCSTPKYKRCPFYIAIYNVGYYCKFLKLCPAFEHFKAENFDKFVQIANEYCLSKKNNVNCARFILRKAGKNPPANLMPDGTIIK